jgi:multidrug efflux pump
MSFTELFIKRPAFTLVLSLVLTIVGFMSYKSLQVRWIPNITPPIVSISTQYAGASASLVENQITTPIENALSSVPGVKALSSRSKQGVSEVTLTFALGHNLNAAIEDVRSALQIAADILPKDAKTPVIEKMDLNSMPIMYIAFSDPARSDKEVTNYVKHFVLPRFQSIDGVATVFIYGQKDFAMRIWLDPMKMAAANVTADDVSEIINNQNIQIPSGQIRGDNRYYSVVTNETLKSVDEFNDLIIRSNQTENIRLKDIGQAIVDAENPDSAFRTNGQSAIALAIIPQSMANPLSVSDKTVKEFSSIQKTLPPGMQANIIYNEATYIHSSIDHVYKSIVEAIIFVLFVIFLFLANWRAAIIPIITIPICLISTFSILYFCGFSINTITLMAFVLAIGLVVDDAIVMLENISRHIESGMHPVVAAIKGSREMVFPIIGMTLTLVAVYAPIAFTSGILGTVFREFAVTLAGSVLISGFIALTLSPMMCARLLKNKIRVANYAVKNKKPTITETFHAWQERYNIWLNRCFSQLRDSYARWLHRILEKKKWVLIVLSAVAVLGIGIYFSLPQELAPSEDMGEIDINIRAPRNASFNYTDSYAHQLEAFYKTFPEIQSYGTSVGFESPSRGQQFLLLTPREKRKQSADELAMTLTAQLAKFPGVKLDVYPFSSPLTWFSEGNGSNVVMGIMSSTDYKKLNEIAQRVQTAAEKYKGILSVSSNLKWDGEQFDLQINREKAADMKVPMQNITNTISTFLAGRNAGYFEYDGNQYKIIVQMNQASLANPNIISQLYVRNTYNKMVPISDLVTISEISSPEIFPHYDRLREDVLYIDLAPGYSMGEAIKALQEIAKNTLPENAKYSFQGQAQDYLESNGTMQLTFLLALLFIYLIMVAQFESFIDPFIILLTVPFAIIGGLLALKLTGCSLNIYSNIGLVTLIGLIAKHGILITEFANQKRASGMNVQSAVIEAAKLRLRPILMTTAAMVLGALPLALASGSGAESREQIGWVIVGGLLFGTFFSLIMVPVAYTFLAKFKRTDMPHDYWSNIYNELKLSEKETS